jgi:hypothetical protein
MPVTFMPGLFNSATGYDERWARYRCAWHLLERLAFYPNLADCDGMNRHLDGTAWLLDELNR